MLRSWANPAHVDSVDNLTSMNHTSTCKQPALTRGADRWMHHAVQHITTQQSSCYLTAHLTLAQHLAGAARIQARRLHLWAWCVCAWTRPRSCWRGHHVGAAGHSVMPLFWQALVCLQAALQPLLGPLRPPACDSHSGVASDQDTSTMQGHLVALQ